VFESTLVYKCSLLKEFSCWFLCVGRGEGLDTLRDLNAPQEETNNLKIRTWNLNLVFFFFEFWYVETFELKFGFKLNKTWTWIQAEVQILEWWHNWPKKRKKWTKLRPSSKYGAWLLFVLLQPSFFRRQEKLDYNK
jgi:hypothetical protein